jgi:hypothetical protein
MLAGMAAAGLVWLTACSTPTKLARFVNANPKQKTHELWFDQRREFTGVEYREVTPYEAIPAKIYRLRLREPAAEGKDETANYQDVLAGRHYTIVALGRKDGSSYLRSVLDDLIQPKPGKASVRLINATVGADDLAAYLGAARYEMKVKIKDEVAATIPTAFEEVDPGVMEIRPEKGEAPRSLSNLRIEAGRLYTFVVIGSPGSLDVIRIEDRLIERSEDSTGG